MNFLRFKLGNKRGYMGLCRQIQTLEVFNMRLVMGHKLP